MIAKHSSEQSHGGEGVEVIENRPHVDPVHGKGQFTEKRIHMSRYTDCTMDTILTLFNADDIFLLYAFSLLLYVVPTM